MFFLGEWWRVCCGTEIWRLRFARGFAFWSQQESVYVLHVEWYAGRALVRLWRTHERRRVLVWARWVVSWLGGFWEWVVSGDGSFVLMGMYHARG